MLLRFVTGRALFVLIFSFVFIHHSYAQGGNLITKDLYVESFEEGMNDWFADNGVWEAGIPTSGPSTVAHGEQVVATILDGDYPSDAMSRLVSPPLRLPAASDTSNMYLTVSHWYSFSDGDVGKLQVSIGGGEWQDLPIDSIAGISSEWKTLTFSNMDTFAGEVIRLGFNFKAEGTSSSSGWYIDVIKIIAVKNVPERTESFEGEVIGWEPQGGQWEFGEPTSGPAKAYDGDAVAGTVLGGAYADVDTTTRLISPPIPIPNREGADRFKLSFWHWFNFGDNDSGHLSVSLNGGEFVAIDSTVFSGESRVWTRYIVPDIWPSALEGSEVQFAFNLNTTSSGTNNPGWYVDMIETIEIDEDSVITTSVNTDTTMKPLSFADNRKGDEWYADNGIWQIGNGTPESGFESSSDPIAGTVFNGTYPNGAESRLISPPIVVEDTSSFRILLNHRFFLSENDSAFVQIQLQESDQWINITDAFTGTSGTDTEFRIDDVAMISTNNSLGDLEDTTVRLGFLIKSEKEGPTSFGWYISDLKIGGLKAPINVSNEELELPTSTVLHQNYPNPFNPTTTLSFELNQTGAVTLTIYDVLGREVETLVDGTLPSGPHAFSWDAREAASGIYMYKLTTPSTSLTRQMMLLR